MPTDVFRLKVTLRGSRPPIWRRLEVPPDITLFQLHEILQRAMGWTDSHLHQFWKGETCYGSPDPEFGARRESERRSRLSEVLGHVKDRVVYEYDFGDGWEHDIVLEAIAAGNEPGVRVLDGRGACPPEDVGGINGYCRYLEAIQNPEHPEHHEMLEWSGPFDPGAFDVAAVNKTFRRRVRRRNAPPSP